MSILFVDAPDVIHSGSEIIGDKLDNLHIIVTYTYNKYNIYITLDFLSNKVLSNEQNKIIQSFFSFKYKI